MSEQRMLANKQLEQREAAERERDELRAEIERLLKRISDQQERLKRWEPQPETGTMSWPKP